ncbi:hypothetical protein SCLCIDRAFT_1113083 [Scleroderma citrinum Foug A]|uniref:Uncharacterized protein n=1 Tax=Scleroderma citrinum Foug A TaxID=1036808 RepID=A0A0C3EHB0_9AGAM|nr:hypothetical protein SCLCIDRAFT_1113083 [Scleroderma citrinum Foug A]
MAERRGSVTTWKEEEPCRRQGSEPSLVLFWINIDLPVDVLTSGERSAATDYGIYYVTARVFLQSNIDPFVHGQLYAILPCVRRQTGHVPSGLTTHTKQPTIANKSRGPFSAGVRAVTRTQKLHTPELIFNFKHGFPPLLLLSPTGIGTCSMTYVTTISTFACAEKGPTAIVLSLTRIVNHSTAEANGGKRCDNKRK